MIVDPWGLVLAQAPDEPTHIVAELDLERQREIRSALPSLANRRDDAYLWPQEVRAWARPARRPRAPIPLVAAGPRRAWRPTSAV